MKITRHIALLLLSFFLATALLSAGEKAQSSPRQELRLMDDWKFHRGKATSAATPAFDDAKWEGIALPHTWNAQDGQDGGGDYFRGDGWYRRHFRLQADWTGRQVYLQFDGANRSAEVFLNGQRLGLHRGGFARFRFDATPALHFTGDNVIAVRVNNGEHDNIAPLLGDFTMFGGLYRGVSLLATDRVQIETLDRASAGVFVRPVKVTPEVAELEVRVELANHDTNPREVEVRLTVQDAGGTLVGKAQATCRLAAQAGGETSQPIVIPKPRLWDGVRNPHLYQVRAEVWAGGDLCDAIEQPFGARSFAVDPARGFSLNGRAVDLRGVNRHQDRAGMGWAISEREDREDMALIAEMGCNMDRTSHYQQSQLWYDLADRQGMVLWTEIPLVYDVLATPELFENAREQLRELIRQNYNHPSICFWGIGNETFVRDKAVTPADTNDRLLTELAALARAEDPSRMSTYASNGDVTEPRASHSDVVGFNHYFGWYHGMPADFATWLDHQHALRPDLKIGMSEYGAGANPAQHEEPARKPQASGQWHPEEWQAHFHEIYWQTLEQRPWVWCKLIWCMFDLASDGRNEGGTPGINDKGIVSADRKTRKDAFYFYKANWSDQPVVHITSQRFTPRTQPQTSVKVYANLDTVELLVNGVTQGRKAGVQGIFLWPEVTLAPGENRIEARALRDGRELKDECRWVYQPAPLVAPPAK